MNSPPDLRNAAHVIDLLDHAAVVLRQSPYRRGSLISLPKQGRLLATGDLHDNPIHFQKIVQLARLDRGSDRHVILHETIHSERLVNGVDLSHRMLVRIAQLVLQYPTQVHPVLANHELAQLTGKGVSKGAGNSVVLFDDGLAFAFGDDWTQVADAIKRFIAAMALAVRTESGVLCAHSIPASHMLKHFDFTVLERDLCADDYLHPHGAAHLMVWGRGHSSELVNEFAQRWNVELFVLGHEHAETGIEVKGPRLIVLNSDHERAVVLPIDLSQTPTIDEALMSAIPLAAI